MKELTDRQKQIVQESIQIIAKKGIQGLTIKNISNAIGISEPAIYRHFKNKNDIILTIISSMTISAENEFIHIDQNNDAINNIQTMILKHTKRFISNPSLAAIVFSEEMFNNSSILSEPVRALMNMNQYRLKTLIEKGQKLGSIRSDIPAKQITLLITGSFRFLVSKWHIMGFEFDLEEEVNEMLLTIDKLLTNFNITFNNTQKK
jgi:TetR/AcrR family transcriptional regulator, fatty acid metabolism regulator protein